MSDFRDNFTLEAQGDRLLTKTKYSSQTVKVKASRSKYDKNGASR